MNKIRQLYYIKSILTIFLILFIISMLRLGHFRNITNLSPKSLSAKPKSVAKGHISPLFCYFPKASTFKKITKPNLSAQRKKFIEQKLSFQSTLRLKTNERKATRREILQFEVNPFTKQFNFNGDEQINIDANQANISPKNAQNMERTLQKKNKQLSQKKKNQTQRFQKAKKKLGNILEGLENVRKIEGVYDNTQFYNSIQDKKRRASKISQISFIPKIDKRLGQTQNIFDVKLKSQNMIANQILQKERADNIDQQVNPSLLIEFEELDSIVSMRDQNFFFRQLKDFNIFNVIKGKEQRFIGSEILQKFNFDFTSMKEASRPPTHQVNREISKLARRCVRNLRTDPSIRSEILQQGEYNIVIDQLVYKNIMSVASGRLESRQLQFELDRKLLQNSQEEIMQMYLKRQKTQINQFGFSDRGGNILQQNYQRCQIQSYLNYGPVNKMRQDEKIQILNQAAQKMSELELFTASLNIKDRALLMKIKKEKEKRFINILEDDGEEQPLEDITQRNQEGKNRNRLNSILEAIRKKQIRLK